MREREMREVLRGEREGGREREREIPGTAALSSPDPITVLDPRGGARDGEVVAHATLLDAAPRRGLHTPTACVTERWWRARPRLSLRRREAFTRRRGRERSGREWERERERGREWERPSRWRRRECVRRGVEVLVAGREVGEVGAAPGDER